MIVDSWAENDYVFFKFFFFKKIQRILIRRVYAVIGRMELFVREKLLTLTFGG